MDTNTNLPSMADLEQETQRMESAVDGLEKLCATGERNFRNLEHREIENTERTDALSEIESQLGSS